MFSRVKKSLKKSLSKNAASTSDSFNINPPSQHIPVGNYESVVDENTHVSVEGSAATRSGYRFNLRGGWHVPCSLYKELKAYPEIQIMIASTGWHRLLDVTMPNSDQKFVEALITRWWDTTHTFHLPLVEIGITPFDFTFLTGIPIGSGDPIPAPDTATFAEDAETEELYFPHRVDDPARRSRTPHDNVPQSMTQGGSYHVDLAQPDGSYHVDTSQFEDSFGLHTGRHSTSYDYDPSRASTSHGFSMAAPDLEYPIDPNLIRNNDYVDNLWSSQDQQ